MKFLGNIIWLILGGLIFFLIYIVIGTILMITIIGIPFGLQVYKLSVLMLWPFGKEVKTDFEKHPILNVIWLIINGITLAFGHLLAAGLMCITIIGIPFAKQHIKLMKVSLLPFGAVIK